MAIVGVGVVVVVVSINVGGDMTLHCAIAGSCGVMLLKDDDCL